jgi:hypothetical protein
MELTLLKSWKLADIKDINRLISEEIDLENE